MRLFDQVLRKKLLAATRACGDYLVYDTLPTPAVGVRAAELLRSWLRVTRKRHYNARIKIPVENARVKHLLSSALFAPARSVLVRFRHEKQILAHLRELGRHHEAEDVEAIKRTPVLVRVLAAALAVAEFEHVRRYCPLAHQKEVAKRVLRHHVPVLKSVGLYNKAQELEVAAFKIAHPEEYAKIRESLVGMSQRFNEMMATVQKCLSDLLAQHDIEFDRISLRRKTYPSMYYKLTASAVEGKLASRERFLDALHLHDIVGARVILPGRKHNCERVFQALRSLEGRQLGTLTIAKVEDKADYVKNPKPNGYMARHVVLHLVDSGHSGIVSFLEVQLVTKTMHERNMRGPAAHALYKGLEALPPIETLVRTRRRRSYPGAS